MVEIANKTPTQNAKATEIDENLTLMRTIAPNTAPTTAPNPTTTPTTTLTTAMDIQKFKMKPRKLFLMNMNTNMNQATLQNWKLDQN